MPCKTILVHLDKAESAPRYAIAAELAARAQGSVTGVYLRTSLLSQYANVETIGYLPPYDLDQLIKEHNQGQEQDAQAAAAALEAAAQRLGVPCAWRTVQGDTPDDLIALARRADLTVLPPPLANPPYSVHGSAVDVAIGSGGPVLVVPTRLQAPTVGDRVLVAWNGAREASRALRDALPLIRAAAQVRVLSVRSIGAPRGADQGLLAWLRSHGVEADMAVIDTERPAQDVITEEAEAMKADLVVMGLYGHPRIQEFVLGGASRGLLHAPPAPLLIAH